MGSRSDRLDSWKEVADYLRRDVRTVQRWEASENLPVHRLYHLKRPTVYAYKSELDSWMENQESLFEEEVNHTEPWRKAPYLVGATASILLLLLGWIIIDRDNFGAGPPLDNFEMLPLTSYGGSEDHPTLSPLGNQVAFSWNGPNEDNYDIYVEQIHIGSRLRLTSSPERDYSPTWSRDGSLIAFLREKESGRSQVLLLPALGSTTVRDIGEIATPDPLWGRQLDWSANGEWLVAPDRDPGAGSYLVLLSLATGERRQVTTLPAGFLGDHSPAFSENGRSIAFVRSIGERSGDVFIVDLDSTFTEFGEPRRLTDKGLYCSGPTWRGNSSIIYSSGTWPDLELREVSSENAEDERLLTTLGKAADSPIYSSRGNRLAFTRLLPEINIWTLQLSTDNVSEHEPRRAIASSKLDWFPEYSKDGNRIVFSSQRSGVEELWFTDSNGEVVLPLTKILGAHCGSSSWSPDGAHVAFHACLNGNCSIYIKDAKACVVEGAKCEEEPCCLRQITFDDYDEFMPSWSLDGRWVYYASGKSGQIDIWKTLVEGGEPIRVTTQGGLYSIESPDGNIYFTKWNFPGLWRQPIEGGEEEQVLDSCSQRFALVDNTVYYVQTASDSRPGFHINSYDLASNEVSRIFESNNLFAWGFSFSVQQASLIWAQFDRDAADLVLIENF